MELTDDQKKKTWLILGAVALIAVILLVVQSFRFFIGARRAPSVPALSESIVGGRLKSDILPQGTNTLEFTAKTSDGTTITDTVTFEVLPPDPYGPSDPAPVDPPNPYDPVPPTNPPGPYAPF